MAEYSHIFMVIYSANCTVTLLSTRASKCLTGHLWVSYIQLLYNRIYSDSVQPYYFVMSYLQLYLLFTLE